MMDDGNEKQEIIIVKRGGHGDHGHHGGAWKIAFADFMTAMMALFLVLWLINAANEETKKSVASYFNPVKLVDRNRSSKGLEESGGPSEISIDNNEAICSCETDGENTEQKETEVNSGGPIEEEAFFADPAETLEEIVTAHALIQEESLFNTELDQPAPEEAFATTDEPKFVDPFSPDYWAALETEAAPEVAVSEPDSEAEPDQEMMEGVVTPVAADDPAKAESEPIEEMAAGEKMQEIDTGMTASYENNDEDLPSTEEMSPPDMMEAKEEMDASEEAEQKDTPAEELAAQLDEELIRILDEIGLNSDQVTLVTSEESVSISLADNLDFSMFGIGSAVPSAELVNAVSVIGNSLVDKEVEVSIVGHTDGRPYSGGQYDNWRLSSARAQSTLYMLERGGLPRENISSIAGVADRQLRNADDSFAPENRRIEILVEFDSP
ncbi:MAG: MotB family protein [Pseudomonadota bacterium]